MALTPAEKQRRYRARQRDRAAVYRVAGDDGLLLALLRSGRIANDDALDRGKVEAALAEVVREWSGRWAK